MHWLHCLSRGVSVRRKVLEKIGERSAVISITANHEHYHVPANTPCSKRSNSAKIRAPSRTNRRMLVWADIINVELKTSCVTLVEDGMKMVTFGKKLTSEERAERVVSSFQGHAVGGVGTPYWLKSRAFGSIERYRVVCFAHGCILRCPTCQNWRFTCSE